MNRDYKIISTFKRSSLQLPSRLLLSVRHSSRPLRCAAAARVPVRRERTVSPDSFSDQGDGGQRCEYVEVSSVPRNTTREVALNTEVGLCSAEIFRSRSVLPLNFVSTFVPFLVRGKANCSASVGC